MHLLARYGPRPASVIVDARTCRGDGDICIRSIPAGIAILGILARGIREPPRGVGRIVRRDP